MLIGVTGYATSGKDTVGKVLIDKGFTRLSFADILRDFLYRQNPLVAVDADEAENLLGFPSVDVPVRLAELVDEYGWDVAKMQVLDVRHLLQKTGGDAGREVLGKDVWVNAALSLIEPGKDYVVTDVRYLNEAAAIKKLGGFIWRVVRPGVKPLNGHASETEQDNIEADGTILNAATLEHLKARVEEELVRMYAHGLTSELR